MTPKKLILFIGLLVPVVMGVFVFVSVKYLEQPVELRKKAAVPGGTATLSLSPSTSNIAVGNPLPVTIRFQTPTTPENKGITGIKATLTYTFTGTNPLTLTNADITGSLPSPWSYTTREVVTSGNTTTINVEAVFIQLTPDGYLDAVTTPQTFAVLNFTAANPGSVNISFDNTKSEIRAKSGNFDVLGLSSTDATYTITGSSNPTPTATANPTPTPTNNPNATATPTPTPTATAVPTHRECTADRRCIIATGSGNDTCTSDTNCAATGCTDGRPGTPTLTSAVTGSNYVDLTWTKASDPVTKYTVTYGLMSGNYIYGNNNVGDKNTTTYHVGSLTRGTKYYFVSQAVNGCMPGSFSNELSATPGGSGSGATPTPTANASSTLTVHISTAGGVVPSRPTFSGKAPASSTISITVNSGAPVTGTTTADSSGNWSWTPGQDLDSGSHTATITATDTSGNTTTKTTSFTVGGALPDSATITPTAILGISGTALVFLGLILTGVIF
jgi:hypothetical protein